MKSLRIGAIGARPAAFKTVRYSEKLLEANGIDVEPIDLSEIFGRVAKMKDNDPAARRKLAAIKKYVPTNGVPEEALLKMAKLGTVVTNWMKETDVSISAVQCWTSIEEYFGVVPCTVMSMMSDQLMPSACEVDICGVIGMYALTLASGTPSALLDWNNNYGEDPDKAVCFHCSNLPKHFFADIKMDYQEIIAGSVGKLNTFGTCVGRVKSGAMSFARFSTNDRKGTSAATPEKASLRTTAQTFGGAGWSDPTHAGPASLHLRKRFRAPCGRELRHRSRHGPGSHHEIPRLGCEAARVTVAQARVPAASTLVSRLGVSTFEAGHCGAGFQPAADF